MKREEIQTLTGMFEAHSQQTENGVEYWLARDMQHLLGYSEWRNFTLVINKAKTACEISGHSISDHFVDVNKMVQLGSGSQKDIAWSWNSTGKFTTRRGCKKSRAKTLIGRKKSIKNPDALDN